MKEISYRFYKQHLLVHCNIKCLKISCIDIWNGISNINAGDIYSNINAWCLNWTNWKQLFRLEIISAWSATTLILSQVWRCFPFSWRRFYWVRFLILVSLAEIWTKIRENALKCLIYFVGLFDVIFDAFLCHGSANERKAGFKIYSVPICLDLPAYYNDILQVKCPWQHYIRNLLKIYQN